MMPAWSQGWLRFRVQLAVGIVVLTALAAIGAGRLVFDDQPRELFKRDDAEFAELEKLVHDFGPDDNDVLLVIDGADLFKPESVRRLWDLAERLSDLEVVSQVQSIVSVRRLGSRLVPLLPSVEATPERYEQARREALTHPMVVGQLLSRDGRTMLMLVKLRDTATAMSVVEPAVLRIHEVARKQLEPVGLRARLAGHPAIRVDLINNTRRERSRFTLLAAVVSSLIALAVFRQPAAVAICVAGPTVGVLWTLGLLGGLGEQINVLGAIIPPLLFVIGFTDSVHLLSSFRRARGNGASPPAAAQQAVSEVGMACGLTSLTTSIAFGSLYVAELEVVRRFGVTCAAGTFLTFVAVITVVPLLAASRLGMLAGQSPTSPKSPNPNADDLGPCRDDTDLAARFLAIVLAFPRLVAVVGMVLSIYFAVVSMQLKPDIRWTESLPQASETRQVIAHCDEVFGGSLPAHVVVEWPERMTIDAPEVYRVTAKVHAILRDAPLTAEPFSFGNIAASFYPRSAWSKSYALLPEPMRQQIIRTDLRRLLVTARVPDAGAARLEPEFLKLEQLLADTARQYPGFKLTLTGTSVVAARNVKRMIGDLARSLSVTAVIVFGVMAIAFRSLILGLVAILPNAFPLLLTSGVIQLAGQPLRIASVLTFSLCLGIAVDDTIHVITRFKRELVVDGDRRQALLRTLRAVGSALIITSCVLLGGYSVVLLSDLPPLRLFAQLSCLALTAALLGDLVLLPALLMLGRSKTGDRKMHVGAPGG